MGRFRKLVREYVRDSRQFELLIKSFEFQCGHWGLDEADRNIRARLKALKLDKGQVDVVFDRLYIWTTRKMMSKEQNDKVITLEHLTEALDGFLDNTLDRTFLEWKQRAKSYDLSMVQDYLEYCRQAAEFILEKCDGDDPHVAAFHIGGIAGQILRGRQKHISVDELRLF